MRRRAATSRVRNGAECRAALGGVRRPTSSKRLAAPALPERGNRSPGAESERAAGGVEECPAPRVFVRIAWPASWPFESPPDYHGDVRPGDWTCPGCQANVFASKSLLPLRRGQARRRRRRRRRRPRRRYDRPSSQRAPRLDARAATPRLCVEDGVLAARRPPAGAGGGRFGGGGGSHGRSRRAPARRRDRRATATTPTASTSAPTTTRPSAAAAASGTRRTTPTTTRSSSASARAAPRPPAAATTRRRPRRSATTTAAAIARRSTTTSTTTASATKLD